ncbi:MAG: hypothetical protein WBQ18_00725 [Solirubrobacteraceae bacterium]
MINEALAAAAGATLLPRGNKVYWGENSGGRISQAALDGSGGSDVTVGGGSVTTPTGTALDPATNRLYWTSYGGDAVWSANLDGTGQAQELYAGVSDLVNGPVGIAIDPATHTIYWTNILNNTIAAANLDGSGGERLLNTTGVVVNNPQGMAIDLADNKLFWGNSGQIAETNLDGTGNAHVLDLTGATANQIVGVAVNLATNKIYWSNAGAPKISFANLDGSGGGGDLNITGATTPNIAAGVALDVTANRIYWASKGGDKISYAHLDNTGQGGDLNTTGATLAAPEYPALLKAPSGTGAPTLSGSAASGSKLTCGRGSWASDLPGAQLYQAPETITYTWTRSGSPVSGATGSTLTANPGGTYRCAATATNGGGSATQPSTTKITVANPPAGGGGQPPSGGGGQGSGAKGAPRCTLRPSARTQTITAAKPLLKLTARCTQAVSARLTGTVTAVLANGHHRTFTLRLLRRSLPRKRSVTVAVNVSTPALSALRQGATEAASFTLVARNAHGTARAGARIRRVKLGRRH